MNRDFKSLVTAKYKLISKRELLTAEKMECFRAVNGIEPDKVKHDLVGESLDAVFGKGTYFSLSASDAKTYIDYSAEVSLLITYSLNLRHLLSLSDREVDGLEKPSGGLTFISPDLTKFFGEDSFPGDELVERSMKKGADAVCLYGDSVDGGEQVIVIPGKGADIIPVSYKRYQKGQMIKKAWF